mgnify:CR=1 FL=1
MRFNSWLVDQIELCSWLMQVRLCMWYLELHVFEPWFSIEKIHLWALETFPKRWDFVANFGPKLGNRRTCGSHCRTCGKCWNFVVWFCQKGTYGTSRPHVRGQLPPVRGSPPHVRLMLKNINCSVLRVESSKIIGICIWGPLIMIYSFEVKWNRKWNDKENELMSEVWMCAGHTLGGSNTSSRHCE